MAMKSRVKQERFARENVHYFPAHNSPETAQARFIQPLVQLFFRMNKGCQNSEHFVMEDWFAVQVMQASFGGKVSSLFDRQLSLSVASPIDGCTSLQNQADVSGTVVIMARGNCYFSIKVPNFPALLKLMAVLMSSPTEVMSWHRASTDRQSVVAKMDLGRQLHVPK